MTISRQIKMANDEIKRLREENMAMVERNVRLQFKRVAFRDPTIKTRRRMELVGVTWIVCNVDMTPKVEGPAGHHTIERQGLRPTTGACRL